MQLFAEPKIFMLGLSIVFLQFSKKFCSAFVCRWWHGWWHQGGHICNHGAFDCRVVTPPHLRCINDMKTMQLIQPLTHLNVYCIYFVINRQPLRQSCMACIRMLPSICHLLADQYVTTLDRQTHPISHTQTHIAHMRPICEAHTQTHKRLARPVHCIVPTRTPTEDFQETHWMCRGPTGDLCTQCSIGGV